MSAKIILASGSASRRAVLIQADIKFRVVASGFDEESITEDDPGKRVEMLAQEKAKVVAEKNPKEIILAADTVVSYSNKIMGKPKFKMTAVKMLKKLSGNVHTVLSGWALIDKQGRIFSGFSQTYVTFRKLTEGEIINYVNNHPVVEWAAGYNTALSPAIRFVSKIDGSLTGLNGLPLEDIIPLLKKKKLIS